LQRVDNYSVKRGQTIALLEVRNLLDRIDDDRLEVELLQHAGNPRLVLERVDEEDISSRPGVHPFDDLLPRDTSHLGEYREVEPTALAIFTLDPEITRHQVDQAFRDGQTKSGTTILPRRGTIRLGKRVEDDIKLVLLDTDTCVGDAELQLDGVVFWNVPLDARGQRDRALAGELNGVANQVRDDLAQTKRVADELIRDGRVNVED
jgi:hypothetical protein